MLLFKARFARKQEHVSSFSLEDVSSCVSCQDKSFDLPVSSLAFSCLSHLACQVLANFCDLNRTLPASVRVFVVEFSCKFCCIYLITWSLQRDKILWSSLCVVRVLLIHRCRCEAPEPIDAYLDGVCCLDCGQGGCLTFT